MKLLREYIRELLTESIDPKIMKLIDRVEENGWKIKVRSDTAILFDPVAVKVHGKLRWDTPDEYGAEGYGPCHRANLVGSSSAVSGFGPILYDVAIEMSGGSGLMSDRYEVSSDARAVWNYYMNNRTDVIKQQLDDVDNWLTPRKEDNCKVDIEGTGGTAIDMFPDSPRAWVDSSLSKVYKKAGTPVMDELERRGLLVGRK